MTKPEENKIKEWVKDETTQYFLSRLAWYLNSIDTVRDITLENINEALARKLAIEIIENALADIYEAGNLQALQKIISEEENGILKRFKNMSEQY